MVHWMPYLSHKDRSASSSLDSLSELSSLGIDDLITATATDIRIITAVTTEEAILTTDITGRAIGF